MAQAVMRTNPYDWINPVQSKQQFAGRSVELREILDELVKLKAGGQCPSVAIVGNRRVGKTSLLLRVGESCVEQSLAFILVNVDDRMGSDIWEFQKEIYYALFSLSQEIGITLSSKQSRPMGFIIQEMTSAESSKLLIVDDLKFLTLYEIHMSAPQEVTLSYQIISHDLDVFTTAIRNVGYDGLVVILDEAHNLLDARAESRGSRVTRVALSQPGFDGHLRQATINTGEMFDDEVLPAWRF